MQFVSVSRPPPAGSPATTPPTFSFLVNIAEETRAVGFTYTAAARTYDVRWFTETRRYGPVTSSLFQGIPLDSAGDFGRSHFRWSPTIANNLQYSGLVGWTQSVGLQGDGETRDYRSIYGVTTLPSDLPTSGTFRYDMPSITFRGGIDRPRVVGSELFSVTIDWTTGRMTGRLTEVLPANTPASVTPIDIVIDGTVNLNTSRVTGTLVGSGFNGNFTGALFGPRGRELSFVFRLSDTGGGVMGGAAGGHNLSGG